jgi:hypothetical protein
VCLPAKPRHERDALRRGSARGATGASVQRIGAGKRAVQSTGAASGAGTVAAGTNGTSAYAQRRRASDATGRAETAQSEIAHVGQSPETLAGAADRNATLADHLRQVADDIGRSRTAMKTAIAQGRGRVG